MTQKEMNMYFLKTYSFTINSPHAIRNGFPKKWEAVFLLLVLLKGKVDASGCSQEKHLHDGIKVLALAHKRSNGVSLDNEGVLLFSPCLNVKCETRTCRG